MSAARLLPWYYLATAVFLLIDYGAGINLRVAFLDPWPVARGAYYAICFACLALMLRRPQWGLAIGSFESLITVVALIFSMAVRILIPNDAIFAENASIVTFPEIINFLISGSVAYLAWVNGLREAITRQNSLKFD